MTSLEKVRARFARNQGLPFADVLTEASILEALAEHGVEYRDRVFGPVTTIWGFLSQVLSADHSCRDAVSRIIAHRAASGFGACSPNTASSCNARSRLHTVVLRTLARRTAQQLPAGAADGWKWNGRSVFLADGSHVAMPDTPQNQARYPQPPTQRPGVGFPLARVAVLRSLATGACHDLAIAAYAGKGTGETTLLREMDSALKPGDVVLADALVDNYFLVCDLRERGIDLVARAQHQRAGSQTAESRPDGDVLLGRRPGKPRGMTGEHYRTYPETLRMRPVSVDARDRDNRLRCKTPEMVRKEIWAPLLAYNLLRTVMAVAAVANGIEPRQLSFKGAKQALTAFAPKIEAARPEDRAELIDALLTAVAYHRVGDRPGRWEPRAKKRRPTHNASLTQPRATARLRENRSKWF